MHFVILKSPTALAAPVKPKTAAPRAQVTPQPSQLPKPLLPATSETLHTSQPKILPSILYPPALVAIDYHSITKGCGVT